MNYAALMIYLSEIYFKSFDRGSYRIWKTFWIGNALVKDNYQVFDQTAPNQVNCFNFYASLHPSSAADSNSSGTYSATEYQLRVPFHTSASNSK